MSWGDWFETRLVGNPRKTGFLTTRPIYSRTYFDMFSVLGKRGSVPTKTAKGGASLSPELHVQSFLLKYWFKPWKTILKNQPSDHRQTYRHWQTVQNQIKTALNAASDQVLHSLLSECTFKTWMKLKLATQHPFYSKWTGPIDEWDIPFGLNGPLKVVNTNDCDCVPWYLTLFLITTNSRFKPQKPREYDFYLWYKWTNQ